MRLLRHPILPFQNLSKIKHCRSLVELDHALLEIIQNPLIKKSLMLSNWSYWKNFEKKIAQDKKNISDFRPSLLRYLDRMSTRTTLFQSLSALSFQLPSDKELLELKIQATPKINDFFNEFDKRNFNEISFRLNPSFWSDGRNIYLWSYKGEKVLKNLKYENKIFSTNFLTSLIVSRLGHRSWTHQNLVDELSKKINQRGEDLNKLISEMLNQEILVKDPHYVPCVQKESPLDYIEFDGKDIFKEVPHEIEPKQFFTQAYSTKDLKIPISNEEMEEVRDIFESMSFVNYDRWTPIWIEKLKEGFSQQFHENDASFLEVVSKLNLDPSKKKIDYEADSIIATFFQDLIDRNGGMVTEEINFTSLDLQVLKNLSKKVKYFKESALSYMAFVTYDDTKGLWPKLMIGGTVNRFYGFYALGSEEVRQDVKQRWEREKKLCSPAILAEVVTKSDSNVNDYSHRASYADYHIPIMATSRLPLDQQIFLSDLRLTIIDNNFVLYSEKLKKQIIPISTHKVIWSVSHPVEKFLLTIGVQKQVSSMSWSWEDILKRSYYPRLKYKNIVLSPKKWVISSEFLKAALADKDDLYEVLKRHYNIDRNVFYVEGDKTTSIDFLSLASKLILEKLVIEPSRLVFMEEFGTSSSNTKESYVHELMIPIAGKRSSCILEKLPSSMKKDYLPEKVSSHISLHISLDSSWCNYYLAVIVPQIRDYVLSDKNITHWFFIKFTDQGPELRIRFFGKTGHSLATVHSFVEDLSHKLLPNMVRNIRLYPYKRLVNNYGSLAGNDFYEKISSIDSDAALIFYKNSHIKNKEKDILKNTTSMELEKEVLWFILSAHSYLQQFLKLGMSLDEVFKTLRKRNQLWRNSTKPAGINSSIHSYFKENRSDLLRILFQNEAKGIDFLEEALEVFQERSKREEKLLANVWDLHQKNELGVEISHYLFRLIHMAKVRISLELDLEIESLLLDLLADLYKNNSYRKGSL